VENREKISVTVRYRSISGSKRKTTRETTRAKIKFSSGKVNIHKE